MKLRYIGGEGFSRDLEHDELAQYDVESLVKSGNYARLNDDDTPYTEQPASATSTAPQPAPVVATAPTAVDTTPHPFFTKAFTPPAEQDTTTTHQEV